MKKREQPWPLARTYQPEVACSNSISNRRTYSDSTEQAANCPIRHNNRNLHPRSNPNRKECRSRSHSKDEPRSFHRNNSLGRHKSGQHSNRLLH